MSTTDTTDITELWREALEVMGATFNRSQVYGKRTPEEPDPISLWYKSARLMESWDNGETWKFLRFDRGDWWRFGLVVEWIERRGGILGSWDGRDGLLRIYMGGDEVGYEEASAPDLPTAAARWVVEHGQKIAEETT